MQKFLAGLFIYCMSIVLSLWVMVVGFGIPVKNWWVVIIGYSVARLLVEVMSHLSKNDY